MTLLNSALFLQLIRDNSPAKAQRSYEVILAAAFRALLYSDVSGMVTKKAGKSINGLPSPKIQ